MTERTHRIGNNDQGEQYIECLHCKRRSFNKNDIERLYCGKCGFHPLPSSLCFICEVTPVRKPGAMCQPCAIEESI